ncbi:MAG: hypothetical protein U1E60_26845 [Reyranellaceae bacterium]
MLRSLVVAALAMGATEGFAQETSFLLINGTSYAISQMSISPIDLGFWTPNVLPAPPIQPGQRRQVTFNAPTGYCTADMRIGFADGGAPAIWQGLNICTLSKIKLMYDRMSGITTASYDE